jgi:hypothetical protein
MIQEKNIIYSSFYPLRRIQEDEDMLTAEYSRITATIKGRTQTDEQQPALDIIKARLDQLQEVKELIIGVGLNEIN